MAPTNTPATVIGIIGAVLTIAGLGFLIANDFTAGTALTVVGLLFDVVAMGTLTFDTPADGGARSPAGEGHH